MLARNSLLARFAASAASLERRRLIELAPDDVALTFHALPQGDHQRQRDKHHAQKQAQDNQCVPRIPPGRLAEHGYIERRTKQNAERFRFDGTAPALRLAGLDEHGTHPGQPEQTSVALRGAGAATGGLRKHDGEKELARRQNQRRVPRRAVPAD